MMCKKTGRQLDGAKERTDCPTSKQLNAMRPTRKYALPVERVQK